MRYRTLGRTGLFVSELCLGTMTFGGTENDHYGTFGQLGQEHADAMVLAALEAGVNFIDTADIYAYGRSEQLTGQAIRNAGVRREDIVLATKVFNAMGDGQNNRGLSRGYIIDGVGASLTRLQVDYIDLYQAHGFDAATPIETTLAALEWVVQQGYVRHIGVSNWAAWQITKALGISGRTHAARFESLQAYYSVADRDLEREIVPMLTSEDLGLMVWSPLAGGLLTGKYDRDAVETGPGRRAKFTIPPIGPYTWDVIDAMRPIAAAHDVSLAQVAIAWLLHQKVVTTVVIGARTLDQLADNLVAGDLRLSPDELATLNASGEPRPEYPGWLIRAQGQARRDQLEAAQGAASA